MNFLIKKVVGKLISVIIQNMVMVYEKVEKHAIIILKIMKRKKENHISV